WKTIARSRLPGATFVTSRSAMRMRPPEIVSRPPIERRRVVFPQPDGPTSTMNSPSSIVSETWSTAVTPPAYCFVTSSRTISAIARNLAEPGQNVQSFPHTAGLSYAPAMVEEGAPGVALVRDTCSVYVLRNGREGVAIDFGSGLVLDRLDALGLDRVTDVLLTHHHRDQTQGLRRAAEHGARIWAPPEEAELVADVDRHWQSRPIDRDYDLSEDRFSLREQVEIAGTVAEYRRTAFGGFEIEALPTPGHTIGSVTYLVEVQGRTVAFTGDLVHEGGRLWS